MSERRKPGFHIFIQQLHLEVRLFHLKMLFNQKCLFENFVQGLTIVNGENESKPTFLTKAYNMVKKVLNIPLEILGFIFKPIIFPFKVAYFIAQMVAIPLKAIWSIISYPFRFVIGSFI